MEGKEEKKQEGGEEKQQGRGRQRRKEGYQRKRGREEKKLSQYAIVHIKRNYFIRICTVQNTFEVYFCLNPYAVQEPFKEVQDN